jgi:hypothetical protein
MGKRKQLELLCIFQSVTSACALETVFDSLALDLVLIQGRSSAWVLHRPAPLQEATHS